MIVVTILAWAGVGKSTLVNHWLRRMAAKHYRSAELVFGWSFYKQGTGGGISSADEFLDAALTWFGDPMKAFGLRGSLPVLPGLAHRTSETETVEPAKLQTD
jgi:hypothetical protein